MSHTIERALAQLVPIGANEDVMWRRKLALAIALGVLKHLKDHQSSVHTIVPNTGGGGTHNEPAAIDIDVGTFV
jgi:hypothetical protein